MSVPVSGFQWDHGNWPKCGKHGVSREEVESLFTSGGCAVYPALDRGTGEERFLAIGPGRQTRWLLVVFTLRETGGDSLIRPISAAICTGRKSSTMSSRKTLKPLPRLKSDAEAERFVDTADLSDYDLSGFGPARFEFEKKSAQVNLRMPEGLLKAVKERAKKRGIPYQRFIRKALERALR